MSVRRRVPFAQIPEWILRADVSAHAVRLWAALDRYADLPHGAVPSRQTLAREWLHASVDTVDRAKRELVQIGALTVEERPGGTNLYWLEDRPTLGTDAEGTLGTDAEGTLGTGAARKRASKRELSKENAPLERASTPRDELWDALTALFGAAATETAKTLRGKVVRSLLGAGATAAEIASMAELWERKMPPGTTFTETALEKHYGLLLGPMERSNGHVEAKRFGRGMTAAQIEEYVKAKEVTK